MKKLETIKNDYAYSCGFENWRELFLACEQCFESFEYYENEVMKIYARECLKLASENVKMKMKEDILSLSMLDDWTEIDKESITNEKNIIK